MAACNKMRRRAVHLNRDRIELRAQGEDATPGYFQQVVAAESRPRPDALCSVAADRDPWPRSRRRKQHIKLGII